MKTRRFLSLSGATIALLAVLSGAALAAGTTVSVRVEGAKRPLLKPSVVRTHGGWITKGGTPTGTCPATSAAGALDVATRHRWSGKYSSGLGIEVVSILGESHPFSSPYFWEIWINNRPAQLGACDLKLHKGDRLLFAPAPDKGSVFPAGLTGPSTATAGHSFRVRAVYYDNGGHAHTLAGARVGDGHVSAVTNAHGYATVDVTAKGHVKFTATETGYIRSAPLSVSVG